MTFYIDIILVENMIMNYIILFATGLITKVKLKYRRLFISSLIGSIYAIMSYISGLEVYMNEITKIVLSVTMIYVAFVPYNFKKMVQEVIIFYLTSFCFGGVAYYLLYYISPEQIKNMNGILTGSYPIKIAILGGILGFFIINIAFRVIKNRFDRNSIFYTIEIGYQGKSCQMKVILDTGNLLVEPITSYPVVIVEAEKMKQILSEQTLEKLLNILEDNNLETIDDDLKSRCRVIPFSSIGKNNGMIIGFKPDYIKIYDEEYESTIREVIIGIYNHPLNKNGMYSGLIGLELLNDKTERQVKAEK